MGLPFHQFIVLAAFLAAYCIQPLLVDMIKFSGGAQSSTFLILLPHYYSMVLVGLLPSSTPLRKCTRLDWQRGLILSMLDIVNQLLKKAGLVFAGAGVYIVVESSSMVWTAAWSRLLLRRKLSYVQWTSIGLITIGIALRACQLEFHLKNEEFVGVVLILISSILMGMTFVLSEMFMNHPTHPMPGPNLVCIMGIACSGVMTLWTCVWTLPQFDTLVLDSIKTKNGNPYYVAVGYLVLLLAGFIHSGTLWYLLKVIGAVSSGVLKGIKVAAVFVISHILFCHIQPGQCLNVWTGTSAAVCTAGVILYSVVTASSSDKSSKLDDEKAPLLSKYAPGPSAAPNYGGTIDPFLGQTHPLLVSSINTAAVASVFTGETIEHRNPRRCSKDLEVNSDEVVERVAY